MNLSLSLSFAGFWSYCTAHYPLILFFDILLLVKVKWNTGRSCFWRVLTQVRVFSLSSGICFSDEHWLRSTSLDTAAIEPNLILASPGWRHLWSLYFWPVSLSSPLHSSLISTVLSTYNLPQNFHQIRTAKEMAGVALAGALTLAVS